MKNRLRLILIILFTAFLLIAFAQNTLPDNPLPSTTPSSMTPQSSLQQDQNRPLHHSYLPRRQTVISLERFQEDIDLNKKLLESNKMLYEVKK
jgi:hypothetical protein